MESFQRAGYSPEAVDTESYLQAHPLLTSIERQIAVAERLLMSFLKELDHRNARHAEEIRRAAAKALARGCSGAVQNVERPDGNAKADRSKPPYRGEKYGSPH